LSQSGDVRQAASLSQSQQTDSKQPQAPSLSHSQPDRFKSNDKLAACRTSHGLALYFSYNSVCRLVIGICRPLMNRNFTCVSTSSGSPSVTIKLAIFPVSIEPTR